MFMVGSGRAGVTWQRQMTSDQGTSAAAPLQDRNTFVTPKNHGLNPNANEFHSKVPSPSSSTASQEPQWPVDGDAGITGGDDTAQIVVADSQDFTYMNGDVSVVEDVVMFDALVPEDAPPMNDVADEYYDAGVVADVESLGMDNGYADDGAVAVNDVSMVTPVIVQTVESVAPPAAVLLSPTGMAPAVLPVQLSPVSPVSVSEDQHPVSSSEEGSSPTTGKSDGPKDLRRLLRDQLEYYFSPENLASDSYLYSQMDADHFVAIATIANFNMVKRLTGDLSLIVDVLKGSPVVQVDEAGEKVRPLHKRCIVILREVPQSTPVEIVKELFSGENCPRFISCEFAINNSWYVTFDSDEDAQRAYRYLREERQTFLGKPIMARIKAKPLLRSTYVPKNGVKNHQFVATQFTPQAQPVQSQVATPQSAPAGVQFSSPPTSSYSPPIQGLSYSQPQQTYSAFFTSPGAPMVPAWPPNTPYYDPGMVFAVNGYQPQAAYKHAPARPFGFQQLRHRNQGKPPLGRNHSTLPAMDRSHAEPARASMYDRQHSAPPAPSSHRPASNRSSEYHGGQVSGANRDGAGGPTQAPAHRREAGSDRHNWRDNASYSGHYERNQNHHMDGYGLPPRLEKEQQLRRPAYRSRAMGRRGGVRDDDTGATKPSSRSAVNQPPPSSSSSETRTRPAPPSPRFQLESTNFPPLPGTHNNNTSGDVFENKMSDVVRGTAKPSTRDPRPQSDTSPVKEPPVSEGKQTASATSPKKNEKRTESSPEKSTSTTVSDPVTSSCSDATSPRSKAKSKQPSSSSAMTNGPGTSGTSGTSAGTPSSATTSAAPAATSSRGKSPTLSSAVGGSTVGTTAPSNSGTSEAAPCSTSSTTTITNTSTSSTGTTTTTSSSSASNAKTQKSQPAKEDKSDDNQPASPPIPAKISYAQMVARAKAANGSDSDSGPLSPAGDEDSSKEDAAEVPNGRPREVWERRDDQPREQRSARRYRENRENRERRERRQYRSPTK